MTINVSISRMIGYLVSIGMIVRIDNKSVSTRSRLHIKHKMTYLK